MGDNEVALKKENSVPAVAFGMGTGLAPSDLAGAWRCAQLVANSGMAPKDMQGKPEAVLVAATMGAEIGLSFMQSLQNIAVINGRPSVWGDALMALVERTGELVEYEETYEGDLDKLTLACTIKATRKNKTGNLRSTMETFSVADARRAGLWGKGGPWTQYPKRMLKNRARAFVLRDLFADVLKGVWAREEAEDLPIVNGQGGYEITVEEVAPDLPLVEKLKAQAGKTAEPATPVAAPAPKKEEPPAPVVEEPPAPKATAEPEQRRRRTTVELADGSKHATAGITGPVLEDIQNLANEYPNIKEAVKDAIAGLPTKEKGLTWFREDEGTALLNLIKTMVPAPWGDPAEEEEPPPADPTGEGFALSSPGDAPKPFPFESGEQVITPDGQGEVYEITLRGDGFLVKVELPSGLEDYDASQLSKA